MPGYVIHMTEAKMICDVLRKNSQRICKNQDLWQDRFLYGSLLPDAGGKAQKQSSHFWNESERGKIIMTPDLDVFLHKYADVLKQNSLYGGYFAHLHLDQEFWRDYIKAQVVFLDADGKSTKYIKNLKSVFIKRTEKMISAEDFFSEDYLYGDYTRLNKMLVQKYGLRIPAYREYHNCRIKEADNKDMKRVLEKLKIYMTKSLMCASELNVLSLETLEIFLKKTAQEFVNEYSIYLIRG